MSNPNLKDISLFSSGRFKAPLRIVISLLIWTFNGENRRKVNHPAPFPVELPKRCIKLFSYVNDLILDPFVGSGTTLVAASLLNRRAIGVEINAKYCEIAKNRLLKEGLVFQQRLF